MIKKLSLISLFTLLPASFYFAQTTVYAYVKDQDGKPIENADVDLGQSAGTVKADKIGYFQFVDLQPGHYLITVSKQTLEPKIIEFDVVADEKRKDLGVISLVPGQMQNAGVMVIDEAAGDSVEGGTSLQPTVGLLSAGRDIFQSVTAFELGGYWFRPRGMDNRYEDVLFDGISMSKNDDGRLDFSNWGGLNDVTRYPYESVDNLTPSEYTFGNLGGVVYYNTRASTYRKQTSLAYSFTNRSYLHRAMATYSSGLSKNGWAFTFSGSRRWAEEGVIDGTQQDSYAYFGAIEKQFNSRHSINLTAFGSPNYRASNAPNTQEVYDLMGKNYNSYWGWQDGEKRNSRIRKTFEPMFILTDYLKVGKTSNWINSVSYQFGSDSRSRLDWFHAADPNPTYYRKLPSYFYAQAMELGTEGLNGGNEITANELALIQDVANSWRTDENVSQINWNSLYQANILNRALGKGAVYTMVEDVNEDKTFNFNSHFDTKLQSNWKLNLNLNYQNLKSDNFRRIGDLLGAEFAYNLDAFGNDQLYNLDDPNVRVGEGDRTQYSYLLSRTSYGFNASTEVDFPKFNIVGSVFSSYSEVYREGDFRNHFYPNNSKGQSANFNSLDGGIKGKLTYKINGKNFIVYNGAFFSLAPTLNEIYTNPRVNDRTNPDVGNQIINSNDLSYILRGQILKLKISGYYTTISNATEVSRYYLEGGGGNLSAVGAPNAFISEVLSGADKRYMGVELGVDVKLTPTFNANFVASVGEYEYTNNPEAYSFSDVERTYFAGDRSFGPANIKGYKVTGTPQKAFSFGLKYNSPKYWWVGASANYLMDQYLDFSIINRTENFYTNPLTGDIYPATTDPFTGYAIPEANAANVAEILKQRKFDDQFMLNANAGKSFLIGKYRMGVSVSVNNILNNRDYVTGGFEQARRGTYSGLYADNLNIEKGGYGLFAPKLWYDRGTTFFANVYLRF